VAIWGSGSKCVSFLRTLGLAEGIDAIVDINPFKQGKYVPGTYHEVLAPEDLAADPPDLVIAMNALYVDEIKAKLVKIRVDPNVVAL
jgi:hypothetical protein